MLYSIIIPVLMWLAVFKLDGGSNVPYGKRGGGSKPSPPPPPPKPPSPAETTRQAIKAQIEAVPDILKTQQEFGPQFTELELENIEKFGPEFAQQALDLEAEFGPQLAQLSLEQQDILDPSRSAGSRAVADFLEAGPEGLSDDDIRALEQQSRSAAASRGLADSGFSAKDEILKNFGARQQLKSRFLDVALSASGRLPAAGAASTSIAPGAAGPGNLVQNVNPSQFFGAQASNNQFATSVFNTQGGIFSSQLANSSSPLGSIAGGFAGSLVGGLGGGLGKGIAGKFFN